MGNERFKAGIAAQESWFVLQVNGVIVIVASELSHVAGVPAQCFRERFVLQVATRMGLGRPLHGNGAGDEKKSAALKFAHELVVGRGAGLTQPALFIHREGHAGDHEHIHAVLQGVSQRGLPHRLVTDAVEVEPVAFAIGESLRQAHRIDLDGYGNLQRRLRDGDIADFEGPVPGSGRQ